MNVGDYITSRRVYRDLPIGSQVTGTYTWTKIGVNQWMRNDTPSHVRDDTALNATGRVRITVIGDGTSPSEVTFSVGMPLTSVAQWTQLPVGTIFEQNQSGTYQYKKVGADEIVHLNRGGAYVTANFSGYTDGRYQIISLPSEQERAMHETPEKFMWMFHQVVGSAAEQNGVPQATVKDAITAIGVPVPEVAPGAEVRWNTTRDMLPVGSIVYCGFPDSTTRFGVFKRDRNGWQHVMGPTRRMDAVMVVDYLPGSESTESWATDPGSEETARAAAQVRARAWAVGIKVKHAHGWCGELESILHRAGLSEKSIEAARDFDLSVGSEVTVEQAAPLPAGTIFLWEDGDDFCLYKRVDDSRVRNISRTRRVFGLRADGTSLRHYASNMKIVAFGDEPLNLPFRIDLTRWGLIPPGSAWHFNGDQRTSPAYIMGHNQRCSAYGQGEVPINGTWELRDLVGSQTNTTFTFTNLETP